MGKYPLSEAEKRRVIEALEDTHPSRREIIMRNAANFASWLAGACYDIYNKVKGWISDFFEWLFG